MRVYFVPFLIFLCLDALAQDYNVSNIPEPLKNGANAVMRISKAQFEILSIDKAEFRVHQAVTILNEQARDEAFLVLGYDKLSSLSEIEVSVFNAAGKRIKKVKTSEINDRSAYTGNLFDDARVKYIDLTRRYRGNHFELDQCI